MRYAEKQVCDCVCAGKSLPVKLGHERGRQEDSQFFPQPAERLGTKMVEGAQEKHKETWRCGARRDGCLSEVVCKRI